MSSLGASVPVVFDPAAVSNVAMGARHALIAVAQYIGMRQSYEAAVNANDVRVSAVPAARWFSARLVPVRHGLASSRGRCPMKTDRYTKFSISVLSSCAALRRRPSVSRCSRRRRTSGRLSVRMRTWTRLWSPPRAFIEQAALAQLLSGRVSCRLNGGLLLSSSRVRW